MLDFWVVVGSLTLLCQTSITSGGGLEKLSSCLVTETPFLFRFCPLGGGLLLASHFDMEGKAEMCAIYVNKSRSIHLPLRMV